MTFQAYLDSVQTKTGRTAAEFVSMARARGLTKHADIVAWLKEEYGLGVGHARAVAAVIQQADQPREGADAQVAKYFAGSKAAWRTTYDALLTAAQEFGTDLGVAPTSSYLSLVRSGKKFAIVQVTAARFDIGVKLKGLAPEGRLEEAGSWNAMVTHRVRLSAPAELDDEVIAWLRAAYQRAG
jgi:hypothetical protein